MQMTANTNDLTTAQRPSLLELEQAAPFSTRHIGTREQDQLAMLAELGYDSLDALEAAAVPQAIKMMRLRPLPPSSTESNSGRVTAPSTPMRPRRVLATASGS